MTTLQPNTQTESAAIIVAPSKRGDLDALLMSVRQALIMMLGAIEDYRGMDRSILPHSRKRVHRNDGTD